MREVNVVSDLELQLKVLPRTGHVESVRLGSISPSEHILLCEVESKEKATVSEFFMLARLVCSSRAHSKLLHILPSSVLLTCAMSRRPISKSSTPGPQGDSERPPKRPRIDHLTPDSFRNGIFLAPMVRSGARTCRFCICSPIRVNAAFNHSTNAIDGSQAWRDACLGP